MKCVVVVFLLPLLGLLHAGPLPDEPVLQPQENFDVNRFMGKWYDIAIASTCPWLKRHKGDAAIGSLELQSSGSTQTISMTHISRRHDSCKSISGEYQLTKTPGRFHYHNAKWNADVDSYVVHTNYDEYALVVMYKQKPGGEKTTSVKLYGKTSVFFLYYNKMTCVCVCVEACKSQPDSGPCFGMLQRYHYNSSIMACQMFTYGGCMGNQNNFVTEKECLQSCRTEAACRLPMDAGPCKVFTDLWAFDSAAGKCVSFKYGGCKGNGNKFYSQKECEEYCGVMMRNGDDEFLTVN
ncbi:protein AMBP [Sinocyclocheilus grahami]|uniref:protein AMBP n=1 Tax=Sinocyclocheilus grahami TaxID=75366 RepID=UPI0007ACD58A|nr:PREDICTED: protein AMBP [Sinocyclocheilus grahami]